MNWRITASALAGMLSACVNPFAIDPDNAESDARDALARNDNDLVGVCGFSCLAPGATPADEERLGVRFIEGTSDMIVWPGEAEYNDRARNYATRYNKVVLTSYD